MNTGNEQHEKETKNRLDNLLNMLENSTDTERHLGEYAKKENTEVATKSKLSDEIERFDIY